MTTPVALLLASAMVLCVAPVGSSVTSDDSLTLTVRPASVEARLGQPIRLRVTLRNASDQPLVKPAFWNARTDYTYTLRDENGHRDLPVKPAHLVYSGPGIVAVPAHAEFAALPSSGSRWRGKHLSLTSNVVEITITP